MDPLSLIGLALGLATVFATQLVEGGGLGVLFQGPAAVIVGLGTLGATLLSASGEDLATAVQASRRVFRRAADRRDLLVTRFRDLALIARKDGLVSLDHSQRALPTPFMQRALRHVIDGCEAAQLRDVLEADARSRAAAARAGAQVFEVAGGYAPTMGILGAVLGLVRAMESLSDPEKLGGGIAIAFVATVYGVGIANLVLLPIAARIRSLAEKQEAEDAMIVEGTIALQAGIAPRTLERMLAAHLPPKGGSQ
ncbi:MAG: flagellar motor protein [Deltaproteobacteria bacterium]|nr:flagellar motor protein [Deltaproteobacteria bacterium]